MEGESSERDQSVHLSDQVLSKTKEELRKAVRSNSHAILARAAETPISEIDIPLCRMIVMTDVRQPLEIDIQKLRSEFMMGYKRGGLVFYVALRNFNMEEGIVTNAMRKEWSKTLGVVSLHCVEPEKQPCFSCSSEGNSAESGGE